MMSDTNKTGSDGFDNTPVRPRLGTYSNNPADLQAEHIAARAGVSRDVGEFILKLLPRYPMWSAERKDGKPVPKGLTGLWKSVGAFEQAMQRNG